MLDGKTDISIENRILKDVALPEFKNFCEKKGLRAVYIIYGSYIKKLIDEKTRNKLQPIVDETLQLFNQNENEYHPHGKRVYEWKLGHHGVEIVSIVSSSNFSTYYELNKAKRNIASIEQKRLIQLKIFVVWVILTTILYPLLYALFSYSEIIIVLYLILPICIYLLAEECPELFSRKSSKKIRKLKQLWNKIQEVKNDLLYPIPPPLTDELFPPKKVKK